MVYKDCCLNHEHLLVTFLQNVLLHVRKKYPHFTDEEIQVVVSPAPAVQFQVSLALDSQFQGYVRGTRMNIWSITMTRPLAGQASTCLSDSGKTVQGALVGSLPGEHSGMKLPAMYLLPVEAFDNL